MIELSFTKNVVEASNLVVTIETSDITPALSQKFLDIQATIEFRLTLKGARHMVVTYRSI